jgi:two-component system sensor kinase FixL
MAVIDARGRIQSVNPAAERIFGYAAAEMVGRNISMLMGEATAAAHDGHLARYRETGRRAIIGIGREVEGRRKDGSIFPLDLSVAEWTSDGETFFTGIMRDISARKAAEAKLAEGEARFRLTQEAVRAGNWETDLRTYRSTLSRESMRLFGLSGDEEGVFGRGEWSALVDPSDRARARARFERAVKEGARFEAVVRVPLKSGGSRWVQMIGQAQYDERGRPTRMTGLNIDVTDQHQIQLALRDSEERLRTLQNEFAHLARVNELGELAAAIAHEINQPLTAITNYLNIGRFALSSVRQGGDGAGEPLGEALEVTGLAAEQAVRAGEIVRRLRAFVGKGTGSRRPESIEEIVDTAMALSLVDAELAGIIVDRHRGAGAARVEVEAVQIQQVMVNLLRNAMDALQQLPASEVRQLTIATRLVERGRSAQVTVRDTGPGIAPDVRARLFEPFVTSKANGMGMGLSLSRRLIEAHGGTIDVQSAAGQGATFRFRLPVHKSPAHG